MGVLCLDRRKIIFSSHLKQVIVLSMRLQWESVIF